MANLRAWYLVACAAVLAIAALAAATPLQAAGLTVNTTADELNSDGDCSLREAVQAANTDAGVSGCTAGGGADIITLPAGIYTLSIAGTDEDANATGDLDVTAGLTITGAGATTTIVDAAGLDRAFHVVGGIVVQVAGVTVRNGGGGVCRGGGMYNDGGTLTLDGVTLSGNRTGPTCSGSTVGGAGIVTTGSLTVNDSTITGNVADFQGEGTIVGGAGILNTGTLVINDSAITDNTHNVFAPSTRFWPHGGGGILDTGTLTVNGSTVTGNYVDGRGGGVLSTGSVTVDGSTFSDNRSAGDGGGLDAHGGATLSNSTVSGNSVPDRGGGIISWATLTLTNVTISGNRTTYDAGGGLSVFGTATLESVTISDNDAGSGADGIYVYPSATANIGGSIVANSPETDCESSTLTSQGYNLIETADCIVGGPKTGDLEGVDPALGSLADNGGPTFTHALAEGSPAVDAGSQSCPPPSTDQRAVSRPQGVLCDIGAFELVQTVPVTIDITPGSTPNVINVSKKGVIAVAVLGSNSFNAANVDPATTCFGDAEDDSQRDCTVAPGTVLQDVNKDKIKDLVLHFETQQTGIDPGDTQACLTGELFDGTSIEGCDSIKTK